MKRSLAYMVAGALLLGACADTEQPPAPDASGATTTDALPGPTGRIVFKRLDPSLGFTVIYTVNPDGSHLEQLFPEEAEAPRWSPDGTEVAIFCCGDGMAAHLVDPDTG